MENNFSHIVSLWKNYNHASSKLTKAMRGTSNIVGEFAEVLICKYYNAKKLPASQESADLILDDSRKIQVKSRMQDRLEATSLGIIRSWNFDILVVVLFSKDGNILKAIEINSETAKKLSKPKPYENGDVLTTSKDLLNNKNAKDITKELQRVLDSD